MLGKREFIISIFMYKRNVPVLIYIIVIVYVIGVITDLTERVQFDLPLLALS